MRRSLPLISLSLLAACAGSPSISPAHVRSTRQIGSSDFTFRDGSNLGIILSAEKEAPPAGAKVLKTARLMTVEEKRILPGACWDYVNKVWIEAGYPSKKRRTVFKGTKKGPFAAPDEIRPGDWVYFINHSYNDVEHSSLFVSWSDKGAKEGYLLSYAGEKRAEPARYKMYDLRHVFQVIRAQD